MYCTNLLKLCKNINNLVIRMQLYVITLIISITIVSCTTTPTNITNSSTEYLCKSVENKLHNNNYKKAIQELTNLKNLYLSDPYPQKIYLYLIYAYYKMNDLQSSNETIQYFFKIYPNYKRLDYVLYMHGLINMDLDKKNTTLAHYLHINYVDRDPTHANIAFCSFIKLVRNHPHSPYSLDAYKRLIFLKNRIAEHELSIIKFYSKKHAYISVITRSEKMLRYFPDTQATHKALFYMHKAYQNIHLYKQANKLMKIISENSEK